MSVSLAATFGAEGSSVTVPATAETDDVAIFMAYNPSETSVTYSGWVKLYELGRYSVFYRVVEAADPGTSFPPSPSDPIGHVGVVYRGAAIDIPIVLDDTSTTGTAGSPVAWAMPSPVDVDPPGPIVSFAGNGRDSGSIQDPSLSSSNFTTVGSIVRRTNTPTFALSAAEWRPYVGPDPADVSGDTWTLDARFNITVLSLREGNEPPNAPTLNFPVSQTVNLAQTNRFDWTFSDNDPDDAQSQFQLQIRPQLSTTNTVDVTSETVNTFYDLAGSTLSADDYEWRVRTWDSQGEVGPYTSWEPFTAAAAPSGPSITDPVNGQTIATETYTVRWSAAEQDAYQLRRVADNAGSPNTATVYFDTGTVTSSLARSLPVAFETNSRTEHVQVRVQRNTLWSDWTSVSVDVSYTAPATPTVTVNDTVFPGGVSVQAAHPTPGVGEPTVETVDLERRQVGQSAAVRVAAGLAPTAVFVDWTVASGVAYEYRARAYGDNGTSTYGAWTA